MSGLAFNGIPLKLDMARDAEDAKKHNSEVPGWVFEKLFEWRQDATERYFANGRKNMVIKFAPHRIKEDRLNQNRKIKPAGEAIGTIARISVAEHDPIEHEWCYYERIINDRNAPSGQRHTMGNGTTILSMDFEGRRKINFTGSKIIPFSKIWLGVYLAYICTQREKTYVIEDNLSDAISRNKIRTLDTRVRNALLGDTKIPENKIRTIASGLLDVVEATKDEPIEVVVDCIFDRFDKMKDNKAKRVLYEKFIDAIKGDIDTIKKKHLCKMALHRKGVIVRVLSSTEKLLVHNSQDEKYPKFGVVICDVKQLQDEEDALYNYLFNNIKNTDSDIRIITSYLEKVTANEVSRFSSKPIIEKKEEVYEERVTLQKREPEEEEVLKEEEALDNEDGVYEGGYAGEFEYERTEIPEQDIDDDPVKLKAQMHKLRKKYKALNNGKGVPPKYTNDKQWILNKIREFSASKK